MSDAEQITLLGGPSNGKQIDWDGGDFVELPACSVPVLRGDRPIERIHVYRRAIYQRDTFTWQGVRS